MGRGDACPPSGCHRIDGDMDAYMHVDYFATQAWVAETPLPTVSKAQGPFFECDRIKMRPGQSEQMFLDKHMYHASPLYVILHRESVYQTLLSTWLQTRSNGPWKVAPSLLGCDFWRSPQLGDARGLVS